MKREFLRRCAGAFGCALALQCLATAVASGNEKILHSFGSGMDGVAPVAGLIDVDGTLYGTTAYGGKHCDGAAPCGTVFSLDPNTGAETVLHSFCSRKECKDGQWPVANLIDVNGTFYGTTVEGGTENCDPYGVFFGCGTIFALDLKTGTETVLHSFGSSSTDGTFPYAGLIDVNGTLYGTTEGGGSHAHCDGGCGTVFSINPNSGVETVVYSFCAQKKCRDGSGPTAGLIEVNGALYGTTQGGGAFTHRCGYGCGTVFVFDTKTGSETVLHSFGGSGTDGAAPFSGLIDVNGVLYGTTDYGGRTTNQEYCGGGCGVVYSLVPATGIETVLYAFCSHGIMCKDGQTPNAGLIDLKGTLYGTTLNGGTYGWGLLFALDPTTGSETVLHAFGRADDGLAPNGAALIDVSGTIYGTTSGGGVNCQNNGNGGCGTVYALRP